jgi:hypothetical protein
LPVISKVDLDLALRLHKVLPPAGKLSFLLSCEKFIRTGKLAARKLGPRTYRLAYADVLRFQRDHVIPNTGRGRPKKNRAEEVPA